MKYLSELWLEIFTLYRREEELGKSWGSLLSLKVLQVEKKDHLIKHWNYARKSGVGVTLAKWSICILKTKRTKVV